jgi:hypothetical protein
MLLLTPTLGENVSILGTLSDSGQLFFIGSVFLLGGFVIRKLRLIVRNRASFSPKQQQPPEQALTSNS